MFKWFKKFFQNPFHKDVPLNTRVFRMLYKYGTGDASFISHRLSEPFDDVKHALWELVAIGRIRPCKRQIDHKYISYEIT